MRYLIQAFIKIKLLNNLFIEEIEAKLLFETRFPLDRVSLIDSQKRKIRKRLE